ncbi:MAG: thymidine kinase [Anaeroplasmataceae bacterium]|nr:thymidine kinase [Anaeroplasmataceae bacterium]MDE6414009.1 thymidine kinase [Anaeroplasmataceae bacterium]
MQYHLNKPGWIEVVCGPMFAGKTEELIRRVKRMDFAKKKYLIFKPTIDNRYAITEVVSHNMRKVKAINISSSSEIKKHLTDDVEAVLIDEVQFFDPEVVEVCRDLANQGLRVICTGLDCDFRGNPFPIVASLLAMAESITKLTAICVCCGSEATMTQRIINGNPAKYSDPTILVGEKESYEPRCRKCHVIRK